MKKTILITGSTDGIGKLVAIKLAKDGHFIYIHGRNATKLEESISEVVKASGNQEVLGVVADLSDLEAVREMATKIKKDVSKLDVLINNAGVYNSSVSQNKDGLDLRFVVNYLAPVLLTNELMPLMTDGKDSRIINLSSAAQSPVSINALMGQESLSQGEAYAQSKLAFTIWSFWLADQIKNVSVIPVNPGSLLNTKMANEAFGTHWSSADKGADILYDLAVSDEHKGITGKYFDNDSGGYGTAHPDAYNQTKTEELIESTKKLLSKFN